MFIILYGCHAPPGYSIAQTRTASIFVYKNEDERYVSNKSNSSCLAQNWPWNFE